MLGVGQDKVGSLDCHEEGVLRMKARTLSCPKCGSSMEAGAILEKDYATRDKPSEWIKGGVEADLETGFLGKAKGPTHSIATYRCLRCGFLESYAGPA
jgi:hypothetical protein